MINSTPPDCPFCGSQQLIASFASRKVYIDDEGKSIPLLTANFSLDYPVIMELRKSYFCRRCNWEGMSQDSSQ